VDTGTINKRPSVRIDDHEPLHRGETVTFTATITDANDKLDALTVVWRVGDTCDSARGQPALTCDSKTSCSYTLPTEVKTNLCVVVHVTDPYSSSDEAEHPFDIENRAPVAKLERTSPESSADSDYPLLTHFVFSGKDSKDDDPGDRLIFTWKVTLPDGQPLTSGCGDASKPDSCAFVAETPGDYQIALKVEDPYRAVGEATVRVSVSPDRPPCITGFFPPSLERMAIAGERNTFSVDTVKDDVNPYPGNNTGKFRWVFRRGTSGTFVRYNNESNRLDINENQFRISDKVQFRVEYRDDQHTDLSSCSLNDIRCELNHDGCAQWITWTVDFI
jgi:hypothetical protein